MTHEEPRPQNEDERRAEERKRMANETEGDLVEKWEGLTKLAREARREEQRRVARNRIFVLLCLIITCGSLVFLELFSAIFSEIKHDAERNELQKKQYEQEREQKLRERVAAAAANPSMAIDEIEDRFPGLVSHYYATDSEYHPSVEKLFDESMVAVFRDGEEIGGKNLWCIRLDEESFRFVKQHQDKRLLRIIKLWEARKK